VRQRQGYGGLRVSGNVIHIGVERVSFVHLEALTGV
jgi:hypothetical protein